MNTAEISLTVDYLLDGDSGHVLAVAFGLSMDGQQAEPTRTALQEALDIASAFVEEWEEA